MISRSALLVLFLAGCVDDVPTLNVTATARTGIVLDPPSDDIPTSFGHYRWDLVETPPDAMDPVPTETTPSIAIVPTIRGIYVYDRWFVTEATEQLSYHVVVTVNAAAPQARIVGPTMNAVGTPAMFDGSTSTSPEQRGLEFRWRLSVRPAASALVLDDVDAPTLTLVPDAVGDYQLELRVFDGEFWSPPAATTMVATTASE